MIRENTLTVYFMRGGITGRLSKRCWESMGCPEKVSIRIYKKGFALAPGSRIKITKTSMTLCLSQLLDTVLQDGVHKGQVIKSGMYFSYKRAK